MKLTQLFTRAALDLAKFRRNEELRRRSRRDASAKPSSGADTTATDENIIYDAFFELDFFCFMSPTPPVESDIQEMIYVRRRDRRPRFDRRPPNFLYTGVGGCSFASEIVACPHINGQIKKLGVKETSYLEFSGGSEVDYFIPSICNPLLMTEEFAQILVKESFTGVTPCRIDQKSIDELKENDCYFQETTEALPNLCFCDLERYEGAEALFQHYSRSPIRCGKCGSPNGFCLQCQGWAFQCPECGERNNWSEDPQAYNLQTDRSKNCFRVIPGYDYDDRSRYKIVEHASPLRGEMWSGNDFFNFGGDPGCSGKVAKWLVENQYGPVVLLPYPVDVSKCTKEQREKIESVRYNHPKAKRPSAP